MEKPRIDQATDLIIELVRKRNSAALRWGLDEEREGVEAVDPSGVTKVFYRPTLRRAAIWMVMGERYHEDEMLSVEVLGDSPAERRRYLRGLLHYLGFVGPA